MYNYHFYIATIMFFFEWWLPETPLILQYLNGICNIPSSLPFVNLDTHSELSTTLVVLAKFSATHTSSSNFVPTIRVTVYTQLKPEQYVKPWWCIFTHFSGNWRSPRRSPRCFDLDMPDPRSWSSSQCYHDLRRRIWIDSDQIGIENGPDLCRRRCCHELTPCTDCSLAIWPSKSPKPRWPLHQKKVYKIHGNSPFLSVASSNMFNFL